MWITEELLHIQPTKIQVIIKRQLKVYESAPGSVANRIWLDHIQYSTHKYKVSQTKMRTNPPNLHTHNYKQMSLSGGLIWAYFYVSWTNAKDYF